MTARRTPSPNLRPASDDGGSLFDALIGMAVDGIMMIDERGIVRLYNKACETLFGYEAAEVIGRNVKMLMPEPYHGEHDGYLHHYVKTGEKHIIGIGREVFRPAQGRLDLSLAALGRRRRGARRPRLPRHHHRHLHRPGAGTAGSRNCRPRCCMSAG